MIAPDRPLRIAVIGGGFTGAAFAIHAVRAAARRLAIEMVEPAARIGRELAYGAVDLAHRINVPSDRMSLFRDDPTYFTRWLFDQGYLPHRESTDALGRRPSAAQRFRRVCRGSADYAIAQSRHGSSLRRRHSRAITLHPMHSAWRVELSDGSTLAADIVARSLCRNPARSAPLPATCQGSLLIHGRREPLDPIDRGDRILIVGTGLTMADVVATLGARGHEGPITAVSRHGLLPREHGLSSTTLISSATRRFREPRSNCFASSGGASANATAQPIGNPSSTLCAQSAPYPGRRCPSTVARVLRRLLPFWEVHRFRISPQAHAAVASRLARNSLAIERAKLVLLDAGQGALAAHLRTPGRRLELAHLRLRRIMRRSLQEPSR